jgi:hypothetical protein
MHIWVQKAGTALNSYKYLHAKDKEFKTFTISQRDWKFSDATLDSLLKNLLINPTSFALVVGLTAPSFSVFKLEKLLLFKVI